MKFKSFCFLFFAFIFFNCTSVAHDLHYDHINLHNWVTKSGKKNVQGSYMMSKKGLVYIEDANDQVVIIPVSELSEKDVKFIEGLEQHIGELNQFGRELSHSQPAASVHHDLSVYPLSILILICGALSIWICFRLPSSRRRMLLPLIGIATLCLLGAAGKRMLRQLQSNTSIAYLDSSFVPFVPQVHTFSNATYYYVESRGIPVTHTMMVGISNHGWQQQVPIPQCYVGTNAWPIPLNPVVSSSPIPVDSVHFTRGAVAIAVNGVPIFNVHTNTGVDSYLDGQLDNFGGHCGRADDYHYHIAPLHLYSYTLPMLPIAWALDGFAVYGALEPDGSAMAALDANHGHFGTNGIYHYHGTSAAPYMIANMVGQVTEDATHQLIPQAAANPIRPALTPLNGALITGCTPNAAGNGYNLTYTLNNATDSVVYYWDNAGHYTYNFYTATGLTTSNYTDFLQCVIPTSVSLNSGWSDFSAVFNHSDHSIEINIADPIMQSAISEMELIDMNGKVVKKFEHFVNHIAVLNAATGIYMLRIQTGNQIHSQKIVLY